MANQTQEKQLTFIEKVIDNSELENINDAQAAAKIVFRELRDMMPTDAIERTEQELQAEAPELNMSVAQLWTDPNVMVAFFSRISPIRQLSIGYDTFMLRLKQEAALPESASPEKVAKAVFSATKAELSPERSAEIKSFLSDQLSQLWQQA